MTWDRIDRMTKALASKEVTQPPIFINAKIVYMRPGLAHDLRAHAVVQPEVTNYGMPSVLTIFGIEVRESPHLIAGQLFVVYADGSGDIVQLA